MKKRTLGHVVVDLRSVKKKIEEKESLILNHTNEVLKRNPRTSVAILNMNLEQSLGLQFFIDYDNLYAEKAELEKEFQHKELNEKETTIAVVS